METLFVKLFFMYLLFLSMPIVAILIKNYLINLAKQRNKLIKKAEKEQQKLQKDYIRDKYKQEVLPYYEKGKALFNKLMKGGKLSRDDIFTIKRMLDSAIGSYGNKYYGYTFKNDAHEIYVKMKSTAIDKYHWSEIIKFLKSCE